MVWQFITKNRVVQHFKAHKLYWLLATLFWWVMSDFLTTPTISSIAIILIGYIVIVILIGNWIKPQIYSWFKSKKLCDYIFYFGLLIICILIALPFWNKLVYVCDRNNPYKKPLISGEGRIEVTIEPNVPMNGGLRSFAGWGCVLLVKDDNEIILDMGAVSARTEIENGQVIFFANPKLNVKDQPIKKPVYYLGESSYAVIQFERLPANSKVIDGEVILSFNGSVTTGTIEIPPQIMEGHSIIVRDIKKYFKYRN